MLLLVFSSVISYAQKKITIKKSDYSYADEDKHPGATVLIGNVIMEHEGAVLTCQKAFYYKKKNFFKALGKVVINQGDTVYQFSDYADYDANEKFAKSWGNVRVKDPKMVLTTDTLYFNRAEQKLFYRDYGTIKDETNTLNSKNGFYFLENKKFTATSKVDITNPENHITSNHLDYYTNFGHAYLYGPSTILNKKDQNKIYTEKGFYNTKTDISHFIKNTTLYFDNREITGDSLYYDKHKGFASATNNIQVIDTAQNFVAKGNYAEFYQLLDSIFMVKKAVAISVMEQDSLYTHGDTLLVTGKTNERIIRAYNNVKIFKSDLQGKCDSIHTSQLTGLTKMFRNPVLWAQKSQITGDSIHFLSNQETNQLDSLKVLGNSFIIQQDSIEPTYFNQIKGRNMYGKFIENELKTLLVKGNGEAVNYNRNNDGELETITKQLCSNIEFEFLNQEISAIKCIKQSDGITYPPSQYPDQERQLKGFLWRETERPKTKEDIFIKEDNNQKETPKPLPKKTSQKPKAVISDPKEMKKGIQVLKVQKKDN